MVDDTNPGEPAVRLVPGMIFGRYVIHRQLGAGGMGAVFEATHADLKKRVAIKVMLPEAAKNPQARARFLREGEAVAKLRHPNVVDIADVGVLGDTPYLVMELLDGEDLGHLLDRVRALPLPQLVDLMLPVLDAVAAAHEVGIVHRDLKPENIFLARTRHSAQEPKLLDFGISKLGDMGTGGNLTATNTMMGTTVYMSPEQAQNSKDVDARADQYSLGAILYEASVGRHPFEEVAERDSLFELLTAIISGRFAPPRVQRPDLPVGFERVVLRAMSSRREDRFRQVGDMARALLPFASDMGRATWTSRLGTDSDAETAMPAASPAAPAGASPRLDAPTFVAGAAGPWASDAPVAPRMATQHASTLGASARAVEVPRPAPKAAGRTARLVAGGAAVLVAGAAVVAFSLSGSDPPAPERPRPTVAAPHASPVPRPTPPVTRVVPPAPAPVAPVAPAVVANPVAPAVVANPVASVDAGEAPARPAAPSRRRHRRDHAPVDETPVGGIHF